ncbi:cupin domain-containing protein [Campylobacter sp. faydin G-24]|uniref:Cupin domain-containing protein n=1 Tax=Campylobacter anatolicus TaxID=2829105 RepID=A0ABS5HIB7_9BACT|nr:cupin domain-containing protein [Campylobacter anatolicus]MBR8462096.1 cupin domain-containing protein [Campylobacter anatolicus]MBR8463786.1 cupin domain-containing protein [Campylobacter anatolicus]MBR8464817.1 cupin domain-containing protein [Campylobacter anatolicus]
MQKIVWKNESFSGVTATKLHEMDGDKEICINIQKGAEMKEHQAPGAIIVQVLKGKIEFALKDDKTILDELDMVTLDANIPHSILALEDSIIRLSLSRNDDVSRVFRVLKK